MGPRVAAIRHQFVNRQEFNALPSIDTNAIRLIRDRRVRSGIAARYLRSYRLICGLEYCLVSHAGLILVSIVLSAGSAPRNTPAGAQGRSLRRRGSLKR